MIRCESLGSYVVGHAFPSGIMIAGIETAVVKIPTYRSSA